MSKWRGYALEQIAKLVAELPADADWKARKKALWGKGYPAHGGTAWGRRIWGQEVRIHLARHGMPIKQNLPLSHALVEAEQRGDIIFPFREEQGEELPL